MSAVFADTFYWIAITDLKDSLHEAALTLMEERDESQVVTTEEVLTEYLSYFGPARSDLRREAGGVVQYLLNNPVVKVVAQTHESFLRGLDLYLARPDKDYSLVDCISMQTMRAEGITEVLTNDRHFEQEGFRALFRQA